MTRRTTSNADQLVMVLRFELDEMEERANGRERLLLSTLIDLSYQQEEEFLRLYRERTDFDKSQRKIR